VFLAVMKLVLIIVLKLKRIVQRQVIKIQDIYNNTVKRITFNLFIDCIFITFGRFFG